MSTNSEHGLAPSQKSTSFHILRMALGFVYFHFGFIKFFPDLSPAELLATQTILRLTGGMLDANSALFWLAVLECGLGLALIFNVWMRAAFVVFLFHMAGTFAPLFVLPELAFKISPLAPTLEGQYILKNVVFVAAAWAVFVPELFGNRPLTRAKFSSVPILSPLKHTFVGLISSRLPAAAIASLKNSNHDASRIRLEIPDRKNP